MGLLACKEDLTVPLLSSLINEKLIVDLWLQLLLSSTLGDEELPTSFEDSDEKEMTDDKEPNNSSAPVYRWSQDNEDVTVRFQLPDGTSKEKIACEIKTDSLDLCVGEDVLLSGPLFAKVNSEESTWTFDKNR